MDAILIFSHGSVLCGAERNLLEIAERLRRAGRAEVVEVGFLNYSEPDYDTALDRCVEAGADRIIIAPFFLVSGRFVTVDLPARIDDSRRRHPGLEILVGEPLGFHSLLADAVLSLAGDASLPANAQPAPQNISLFCRRSAQCPLYQSPGCLAEQVVMVEES